MKKFELPYNFDNDYFSFLNYYKNYFKYIKFIYLPAFKEANIQNTRETSDIFEKPNYNDYNKYISCIKQIQSLNLDVCILIQKNATLDIIKKYIEELNIKYFIINDDELAKTLKTIYKDKIYLILSITRGLTYEEIMDKKNDYSMYDEIVLYFWFNRRLDKIKELPKTYKYTILVNSRCCAKCPIKRATVHWFNNNSYRCERENDIEISPNDLYYYDSYITTYKIVDRLFPSNFIFADFKEYIIGYENINNPDIKHTDINYYNIGE